MNPGVTTVTTYTPAEILGPGAAEQFLRRNCTIEEGQVLVKGDIIGLIPSVPTKYAKYDNDAVASATVMSESSGNTGNGALSAVEVIDDHTLTEDWTLECVNTGGTGVGLFSLTGTVSGLVSSTVPVGSLYKYPNTAHYQVQFTISDGGADWTSGDIITFSTTRSSPVVAEGVLAEACDATEGDRLATYYTRGNFMTANLGTTYDVAAVADMNGRVVQGVLQI
jgi:hypothetical protein